MAKRQIHLGAVTTPTGGPGHHTIWRDPEIPGDASVDIDWYISTAKQVEAALFDLVFIVDSQFITPHSPPHYLNRLEPLTLLSALATHTKHVGLVGTATTSFNSPFNLVRRLASLDLISHGRAGWNVVTTGDAGTAFNYGLDEMYGYDTRYGRAHEYIELARALWDSYEDDAFPRDRETGQFMDPSKQHTLNWEGEYFKVRGPLNIERSQQGHPVIFQAGDSDQGRDLGARLGEGIFTHAANIPGAQAFYNDIKTRAKEKFGREAHELVIMPGIDVVIADTDDDARELEAQYIDADHTFEAALGEFGRPFGWHDFTQYDLDAPFPTGVLELAKNAWYTQAKGITDRAAEKGWTLREAVEQSRGRTRSPFVGSPETVAATLIEWFESHAADGYNIHIGRPSNFARFVNEVIPILQDKGVYRTEYESDTLRGNMGIPIPENRYTAARRTGAQQ
ncbi:NtaA/DmoA family FMN-dependent monooxygenase [Cumulibacter soli]|uniref:NtaA/DmoA family FMN-dependent monooxygenase n=1 Tax=Cumulibacter soli TaxID=2546344 RepID=UPI0010675BD6|nr:NtaA/DmoA family FMN-dependent monooxygenase [Cumulibacter soli]